MNKNLVIIVLAILVLAGFGYYFFTKFRAPTLAPELPQPPTPPVFEVPTTPTPATPTSPTPTTATPTSEVIIKITANGFEPKEVEISKGTKVTWINEQPSPSWPASDVHPTHEVYPGSSIKKCGTPEQNKIFDACHGFKQGEKWSFVFNKVGEWYYHDHLNPSWTGEIVVK
jgi:plastocyanin